jgi:hypothetical protein
VTFLFPIVNTVDDILIFTYNKMLAFIILGLIAIIVLLQTTKKSSTGGGKKWTVFGTMGCGWTRKQLDYMKKNGKPHTFVDCDKGDCGDMDAFPTLQGPNGEELVGYSEI